GGLEIALACDLRIATAGAYRLGTPEVTLGLLPGNGGTQRLTRMLGTSRALDLLLTGKTLTPQQAHEWGLLAEVFEDEAEAEVYIEGLAAGPALALRNIKRCVYEGGQLPLDEGVALEGRLVEELFRSEDGHEGLTAFVEKRPPAFTGA
ncbi:MAG TPA: enoyl-CoA hydratase-related protein, partial [Thermoleophilaceae bacterium]